MVTRRNILAGIGSGIALARTNVAGKTADTVEVVTIKHVDDILQTQEVSADWWDHIRTAREVRASLREDYRRDSRVTGIDYIVDRDHRIDGRYRRFAQVRVQKEHLDDIQPEAQMDGIAIKKEPDTGRELHCSEDEDKSQHNFLPGGAEIHRESQDPDDYTPPDGKPGPYIRYFSAGCRVYFKNDSQPHLITCAHSFPAWDCNGSSSAEEVEHRYQKIGHPPISSGDVHLDYAIVHADDPDISGISGDVKHQTSTGRREIVGRLTKDGFDTFEEDTFHKYGARTSHTSGGFYGFTDGGYCSGEPSVDWFVNHTCSMAGDSGCPHYVTWYDHNLGRERASLAGIHHGLPGFSEQDSEASTAFEIYDAENGNIAFGQPP